MLHRETNVSDFAKSVERQTRKLSGSGGKGIRTPGLLIANETLYQLSYTPILPMKMVSTKIGKNFRCTPLLHTCILLYGQNPAQPRRPPEGGRISFPLLIKPGLLCPR